MPKKPEMKWDPDGPMTMQGIRDLYGILWALLKRDWWGIVLIGMSWLVFKDRAVVFAYLTTTLGLQGARSAIAAGVVLVGISAFLLKRLDQFLYGLVEVAFAVLATLNVSAGMKPEEPLFARWATLAGLVYVVSRGLSNMADGPKKHIEAAASPTHSREDCMTTRKI